MRGADCNTDHHLLRMKLQMKSKKGYKMFRENKKVLGGKEKI